MLRDILYNSILISYFLIRTNNLSEI